MKRKPEPSFLRKARRLAGFVLLSLPLAAGLRADAPPSDEAIPLSVAGVQPIEGPASVTLGAEAQLELPAGWRLVAREQMAAWWASSGRRPGAWDRGLLLPEASAFELRLIFEPMGAVGVDALPDEAALLLQAQERARRAAGGPELVFWRWEPFYQPELKSLRFGGVWRQDADDSVSMHVRWLARRGTLKLDWRGPEDDANAFGAVVERIEEGLSFRAGHGLDALKAGDPLAPLDLSGLVLDGLFGRAAALPGGAAPVQRPWWHWLVAGLAGLTAVGVALFWLIQKLLGWMQAREKARKEAQRLAHLERSFGGRADEVEILEEDEGEKPA